ncbi:MAG: dihydroxy-acid dehydratase, partial [Bacilli bacterium]
MNYNKILQGDMGALKRALYKAAGHSDENLKKPLIGICNSFSNAIPGHVTLNSVVAQVAKGIEEAGGESFEFGMIAPCDGIAEGHDGMRYILASRDLIASSIECMVRAHNFDGIVLVG